MLFVANDCARMGNGRLDPGARYWCPLGNPAVGLGLAVMGIEAMMDSNSPPTGNPMGDVSDYGNGW